MEVETTLRGVSFRGTVAKAIVANLEEGDELLLIAEPENPYDVNAVRVVDPATGEHLGYVAKEEATSYAEQFAAAADFEGVIQALCTVGLRYTMTTVTLNVNFDLPASRTNT